MQNYNPVVNLQKFANSRQVFSFKKLIETIESNSKLTKDEKKELEDLWNSQANGFKPTTLAKVGKAFDVPPNKLIELNLISTIEGAIYDRRDEGG